MHKSARVLQDCAMTSRPLRIHAIMCMCVERRGQTKKKKEKKIREKKVNAVSVCHSYVTYGWPRPVKYTGPRVLWRRKSYRELSWTPYSFFLPPLVTIISGVTRIFFLSRGSGGHTYLNVGISAKEKNNLMWYTLFFFFCTKRLSNIGCNINFQ